VRYIIFPYAPLFRRIFGAWFALMTVGSFVGCTTIFPRSLIPDAGQDAEVACGDGVLDVGEQCDGTELDGQTCQDLGHDGGELSCSQTCTFDTTLCTGGVECGDGVCQFNDGETRVTCPQDCGWTGLDGGDKHSCGVKGDGSAWCWGRNDKGQLGTGDSTSSLTPVRIPDLTNIEDVSAGWGNHSCALGLDGTVWCWGENPNGELGTGDQNSSLVPLQVPGLANVAAVSLGKDHTCVLKDDGTIWCWGANDKGQLGIDVGDIESLIPMQVVNLTDVEALSAGKEHNCATTSDGSLYCWGENMHRQTDPNDPGDVFAPVANTGLTNVEKVSAGGRDTCALLSDQTVWCWGDNDRGQVGMGSESDWEPPTQVVGLTGVSAVHTGESVACALLSDQTVWCWGENNRGQLGNDSMGTNSSSAVQVLNLGAASGLMGGKKYLFAQTSDGSVLGWGENDQGQIGDGTNVHQPSPVQVQD
jgi:alpha-tubulin suppressor-like RCC1 family protein